VVTSAQQQPAQPQPTQQQPVGQQPADAGQQATNGGLTVIDARRLWPDVVQALSGLRRATWALLSNHAQVVGLQGDILTIGFTTPGLREQYSSGGHEPHLKQALVNVIGAEWRIEAIVDPGVQPGATAPAAGAPRPGPEQPARPDAASQPVASQPPPEQRPVEQAPPWDQAPPPEPPPWDEPEPDTAPQPVENRLDSRAIDAAREAIQPTRTGGRAVDTTADELRAADAHAHPDDLDADVDSLGGAELLARELGAQIIEEIRHQ
jgi:DNA polymerase-3 subunit gamma/tau